MVRMYRRDIAIAFLSLLGFVSVLFVYARVSDDYRNGESVSMSLPGASLPDNPEPSSGEVAAVRPSLPFLPLPSMDRMKREGCVADGLLNGDFPGDGKTFSLINESSCYYLHRSIETWLSPPDWMEIDKNMKSLRPDFLHSMFIAEAIDVQANYFNPEENRDFEFREMCRPGSKNFWGEHTCKPSLKTKEYRQYVRAITREAMNRGVQVFMFGQVYLQDAGDRSETAIPDVIAEMRQYAATRNMRILVGAQTNDIDDPKYLRLFDFIEGGVGIDAAGNIENGPCFSRWWKKEGDWCWGLLWHDRFSKSARNVFLHYDWSGKIGDDMSVFTRMSRERREETTRKLYRYFTGKNMGFLLPYLTRLHVDNGGCVGPAKRFYTPDDRYGCDDETAWNRILEGK